MHKKTSGAVFVEATWRRFLGLSWAVRFAVGCTAGVAAFVALCWLVFGFGSLNLDPTGLFLAILGIIATIGLGVGLMTLAFYSERSGRDDAVQGATVEQQDTDPRAKD